jgi:type II secretory pathway pseudopilin PulG
MRQLDCSSGRVAPAASSAATAFTLLELVLALAVTVLLASVVILSLTGLTDRAALDEGARRVQAMLHFARAEAAAGRQIRLEYDAQALRVTVLRERDPLVDPGLFDPYEPDWAQDFPSDQVRVALWHVPSAAMAQQWSEARAADPQAATAIAFRPDGSCDSAIIHLVPVASSDARHVIIELDGMSGRAGMRILDAQELADFYEQSGLTASRSEE